MTSEKTNESLIVACLQICWELLLLVTFLRVHSNSGEVLYLSWQNRYPNLKVTSHIKLKFFLWTKLLENLLFARCLISDTALLNLSWWRSLSYHLLCKSMDWFYMIETCVTKELNINFYTQIFVFRLCKFYFFIRKGSCEV